MLFAIISTNTKLKNNNKETFFTAKYNNPQARTSCLLLTKRENSNNKVAQAFLNYNSRAKDSGYLFI